MKKGVTLVEVLVASIILVITISGTLFSFVTHKRIIKSNSMQLEAINLINYSFEKIQRAPSSAAILNLIGPNVTGINGDGTFLGGTGSVANVTIGGVDGIATIFTLEFDMGSLAGTDLSKIYSRVKWRELGIENNIVIQMYSLE